MKDNQQLVEYSWDVFTITKYFVYHCRYVTRAIKRASMAELKSEEVQQQEADEEEEQREEAIANPRPYEVVASDGTGSILTLESLYLMRHLDFIELLNDQILILGFK